jgi:hypothetical protein
MPGSPSVISGTSSKSGTPKPYRIVKQAAMLANDDGTVEAFMLQPPKNAEPFKPGRYALGFRPFVMNGELRLAPTYTVAEGTK